RLAWLRARMPALPLPVLDDAAVAQVAIELLGDGTDLRALRTADVAAQAQAAWPHEQRRALASFAPAHLRLPWARSAPIDYGSAAGPTVRARLQELFGLAAVPALADGAVPVVLELLAPNQRPVQVTTDLPSFWRTIYPQVRRELARRYPRH